MILAEELKRIKNLIMELSPHEPYVQDFLDSVYGNRGLLNHMQFETYEQFVGYVLDCDYEEYNILKKEAKEFLEKREKQLESELDEIQRVSQYLSREENIDVTVDELKELFNKAVEIKIPKDILSKLENTECNTIKKGEMKKVVDLAKKYNKSNPLELKKGLSSGEYDKPLILKMGNRYHLVAGNTRLCTAVAMGMRPNVIIATLN